LNEVIKWRKRTIINPILVNIFKEKHRAKLYEANIEITPTSIRIKTGKSI